MSSAFCAAFVGSSGCALGSACLSDLFRSSEAFLSPFALAVLDREAVDTVSVDDEVQPIISNNWCSISKSKSKMEICSSAYSALCSFCNVCWPVATSYSLTLSSTSLLFPQPYLILQPDVPGNRFVFEASEFNRRVASC